MEEIAASAVVYTLPAAIRGLESSVGRLIGILANPSLTILATHDPAWSGDHVSWCSGISPSIGCMGPLPTFGVVATQGNMR